MNRGIKSQRRVSTQPGQHVKGLLGDAQGVTKTRFNEDVLDCEMCIIKNAYPNYSMLGPSC